MSSRIPMMPLDTLQASVGDLIEASKKYTLPLSTLALMSIAEYLKDAGRWQYARDHEIPAGLSSNETLKYVDERLREVDNHVERIIRPR